MGSKAETEKKDGDSWRPLKLSQHEESVWVDVYTSTVPDEFDTHDAGSNGAWAKIEYAKNAADFAVAYLRKIRGPR